MSPAQHDMIEVINGEAEELARMVEDFLVAARFDHDIVELDDGRHRGHGNHQTVIEAAEAAGRGLQIDPRELWVKGDRDRIVHITRNLLSNAIAHGGPNIRVVVLKEEGRGTLVIADDGPGIPSDASDSLFEPFINEGTRALVTGSLGMGLAVARELAREMEGDLTLERTVDGWTCFSLSLPAAAAAGLEAVATEMVA